MGKGDFLFFKKSFSLGDKFCVARLLYIVGGGGGGGGD